MLSHLFRRPVLLRLDRVYRALPLRLLDLAELEALAVSFWDHPADGIDAKSDRAALRAACDIAEEGPPEWGSRECYELALGTEIGRLSILGAVLRPERMAVEDLNALADRLDAAMWRRVERVAWGVAPLAEVLTILDEALGVPRQPPTDGGPVTELVCKIAEYVGCLPYQLAHVTLPELALIAGKGKPANAWGEIPEGWTLDEWNNRVSLPRAAFFAETDPERN